MVEFKHLLYPTDLSEASQPALKYAASLARWYGARLTVLHVVPTFDPITVPSDRIAGSKHAVVPPSPEEVLAELRRAVSAETLAGIDARLSAEAGDAARVIVRQAVELQADLVVMGTHGRGGFDRLVHGSVTEKVLRRAPCPVLTVPPHAPATPARDVAFGRILCALDFSASSRQALALAIDVAGRGHGSVTALHVVEWIAEEEPRVYTHFNVAEYRGYLVGEAQAQLRELVAAADGTQCTIEEVVVTGRAHREVQRIAEDKAVDLIVLGAQGRGGVDRLLFGSTTHHLVRAATCPVLVVR